MSILYQEIYIFLGYFPAISKRIFQRLYRVALDKPNQNYVIKKFVNCKTTNVIYVAKCNCPKLYVGKTTQEFRRRISAHLSATRTGKDTSLAKHIRLKHDGDMEHIRFWGIDTLKSGPRKGNIDRRLMQLEARWIYRLKTLSPLGLNEGFTFTPFI